jgi:hypothetical protein
VIGERLLNAAAMLAVDGTVGVRVLTRAVRGSAMEEFLLFSRLELLADWVSSSWARGAAALATQSIFDFERSPSG